MLIAVQMLFGDGLSASSLDEIEEMASKDVEDTKEKLESERNALGEKITDFEDRKSVV